MSENISSNGAQKNNVEISNKEKIKKELKSIPLIIILVFAFRSTFFEPFKIPTGSMISTLLIGDFILVNKFAYGFKIPFTEWFSKAVYMTGPSQPLRGDVIVFTYPKDPSFNYIKRLVGLPGDTIEVIGKTLYINNQPIVGTELSPEDSKKIMDDMDEKFGQYDFHFFESTLGEHKFVYQLDNSNSYSLESPRLVVPENHYFVMGDNRDYSYDSRAWGFVPFENVKGKAIAIWFSLSVPHPWAEPGTTFKFRPWRIGTKIE